MKLSPTSPSSKRKRHNHDEILGKLRQAETDLASGQSIAQICQKLEVSEQTFYRWRAQFSGMKAVDLRRFQELEQENVRLKKLVVEQALDNAILKEALRGNY